MVPSKFSQYRDIDSAYFVDHYSRIYKVLDSYFKRHKKLPSFDFFEESLYKNRAKIFPDLSSTDADAEIISFRAESTFVEITDLEFLIDELKQRYIFSIAQKEFPQVIEDLKKGYSKKGTEKLQEIVNTMNKATTKESIQHSTNHEYIDVAIEKYNETKSNPVKAWGIKLGFKVLDMATFGIKKGEMFIIGGRHGAGKSVFLLSAALNAFRAGKNVVYVSLEMPTEQMWDRVAAAWCGLPISEIIGGTLSQENEAIYQAQMHILKNSANRFEVIDAPHVTVPTIAAELDLIVSDYQPDLLVVDYLGIVKPTDTKLQDNLAQASVVEDMRALARHRKIALFTAVQMNRDPGKAKQKGKTTERVSRSDTIGATADVIMLIDEVDAEDIEAKLSDKTKIFLAKNRKGPQPTFEVRKDFNCTRFLDWDPDVWQSLEV